MTRYRPEHKEATRRRLIETAYRDVRQSLAAKPLRHRPSFRITQLTDQAAVIDALPVGPASMQTYLRQYLSPAHRDDRAGGCPSAALLDEIGRCDEATRAAYTVGVEPMIAAVARHLDDGDPQGAQERAIGLLTLLVGSLQLARAVTNPALSQQILATAYTHALSLAGVQPGASTLPVAPPTQESS